MRLLLIAGFLDADVREQKIFRKDSRLFHWVIKMFGLPSRVGYHNDHAPWVRSLISFLENQENIDLHVVGPQIRLKKRIVEYEQRGVHYHFYNSEWSSLLRIINHYRIWKRLQTAGPLTRRIARKVNPDLVILSGTENPATSISILYVNKYPRYCLCQTVYNNPERALYSIPNRLIQDMEKDIISELQFFGVYSEMHYKLLREMNPNAFIFKFGYPSNGILLEPIETAKQFDFVNFALKHGSRKGTQDSIQALALVKKVFPNVTLNIVGGLDDSVRSQIDCLVKELDLNNNVIITPFFREKKDLLIHIQKSRFAVLPCKLDYTSGTMIQAMQLGLPLVVYRTQGTPLFNSKKECALIAEKNDIIGLASKMLYLMENPNEAALLSRNAREIQEKIILRSRENGSHLINNFTAIINNDRIGVPIPENQLFNPETND